MKWVNLELVSESAARRCSSQDSLENTCARVSFLKRLQAEARYTSVGCFFSFNSIFISPVSKFESFFQVAAR